MNPVTTFQNEMNAIAETDFYAYKDYRTRIQDMIDKKNTLILVALEQELPKSYLPGWKIIYSGVGKVNASFAISRSYFDYKPAISKVIAPAALFWFRWGALVTVITGLILAYLNGYLHQAMTFSEGFWPIGVGMWLGIIMLINVWGVIWPNQKRALGIIEVDADTKAIAAKKAMLFSRTNTLLSIPILVGMTVAQNGFA